ncbi:hypothetical protein JCM21900_003021 [Sporobolomyces salmonicolor]
MSVTLSPSSQLGFQRPLTQLVKRSLAIHNPGRLPVQMKIKTTAPKQYCVRPNSGRIEPGETVEVQVLLQPMKEDPPPGAKCRDKFLVQSVIITPEREGVPLTDLWQVVEKEEKASGEKPGQIFEQKIRCTYLPAADSEPSSIPEEAPSKVNDPSAADASFVSTTSPAPRRTSRSTPSSPPNLAPDVSTSPAPSSPGAAAAHDASSSSVTASSSATGPGALENPEARASTPAPLSSAPTPSSSSDELSRLRSDLAAAQSEISRLRAQLAQAETTGATLRSRGGAGAASGVPSASTTGGVPGGTAQAVVGMQGQEGVPVQVVAGIAFGVFVVTWLFF